MSTDNPNQCTGTCHEFFNKLTQLEGPDEWYGELPCDMPQHIATVLSKYFLQYPDLLLAICGIEIADEHGVRFEPNCQIVTTRTYIGPEYDAPQFPAYLFEKSNEEES